MEIISHKERHNFNIHFQHVRLPCLEFTKCIDMNVKVFSDLALFKAKTFFLNEMVQLVQYVFF